MLISVLLLLTLRAFQPNDGPAATVPIAATAHLKVANWRLVARTDRFTGKVYCRLYTKSVSYERHALIFHLPLRTEVAAALYRVDDGQPIFARANELELAGLGFALHDDDDLMNPSKGIVRIPLDRLAASHNVWIEPRRFAAATRFNIDNLGSALAAFRGRGCVESD